VHPKEKITAAEISIRAIVIFHLLSFIANAGLEGYSHQNGNASMKRSRSSSPDLACAEK
jgi:hypothetical protein